MDTKAIIYTSLKTANIEIHTQQGIADLNLANTYRITATNVRIIAKTCGTWLAISAHKPASTTRPKPQLYPHAIRQLIHIYQLHPPNI